MYSELDIPLFGCIDSGFTTFKNKIAIILGQRCEYLHGEFADNGRRIKIVLKGNKLDAPLLKLCTKVEHFLNESA